jgi:uncharacterized repeat protein (TIGR03803 family)
VKESIIRILTLVLGMLLATTGYAQPSSPTITQLFGFACDSTGKICADGAQPNSLIQSADGNFYGTTDIHGSGNQAAGTVFEINSSGQLTTLYTFVADQNGNYPNGNAPTSLVEGNDGFLYGTAAAGGAYGNGVVFKLRRTGTLQVLHNFCSPTDCRDSTSPYGLLLGRDGNFYGLSGGVVFRITPSGSFTLLHTFDKVVEGPTALGMTQASDGNFYGTTQGAQTLLTTLFRLAPAGKFTTLHTFHYGQFPDSAPIQALNGKLYHGLSRFEDQSRPGFFESSLSGKDFRQFPFQSVFDESLRFVTQTSDTNLWIAGDGASNNGSLISISPNGKHVQTIEFDGTNGSLPDAPLVQGSDGRLFGVTQLGGSVQQGDVASGVVFTMDAGLAAPKATIVTFNPSRGKAGSRVMIHGIHFVGATAVTFNGVSAKFQVPNTGNILVTVPQGATTGPIAVTNAGGTTTSKKNFTIQ